MADDPRQRLHDIGVEALLHRHPNLRLRPVANGVLKIVGLLSFSADALGRERISDRYEIEIAVPRAFPKESALVRETGGRVPKDFHTNGNGTLCLGSPTQLRLALLR